MTGPMVEGGSFTPMEMSMRASGRMIKLMGREFTPKMMDQAILVNGQRIYSMVLALKDGLMALPTRGTRSFMYR